MIISRCCRRCDFESPQYAGDTQPLARFAGLWLRKSGFASLMPLRHGTSRYKPALRARGGGAVGAKAISPLYAVCGRSSKPPQAAGTT